MKTRAAVCRAFGQPLSIEEVELAEPGQGEIRVAIKACAICHSDIFFWEGAWGGELAGGLRPRGGGRRRGGRPGRDAASRSAIPWWRR